MENQLKYIWVKDFKVLQDFEINLCHTDDHMFSFKNGKLLVKENPKQELSFGSQISSITAIAGKNGSGKSTLCEIILGAVATLQNGSMSINYAFDGIVVVGETIFHQNKVEILNSDSLAELGYRVVSFDESPHEKMGKENFEFTMNGFIYYSNFLDRRSSQNEHNLLNISSQFTLLEASMHSALINSQPIRASNLDPRRNEFYYTEFEMYMAEDDYKLVVYLLNENVDFLKDHHELVLRSSYSHNNRYLFDSWDDVDSNRVECILDLAVLESEILGELVKLIENDGDLLDIAEIKTQLHNLYKLNLVRAQRHTEFEAIDIVSTRAFIYEGVIPSYFEKSTIEELVRIHKILLRKGIIRRNRLLHDVNDRYSKAFLATEFLHVPCDRESKSLFKKFIYLESKILNSNESEIRRISNYQVFPYPSAGEGSLLGLFSRLYDSILRHDKGVDQRESLIVFLDEPDVGFHPEWKRELVQRLINFFNSDFNRFNIQLILTTHSPYILSDLSNTNIRLIRRVGDESPRIVESETKTFGANIYDLLADGFFLENGFIGEYAQKQIDRCFKLLNQEAEISDGNKQFVETIIDIVSEPLLKKQLVELFDEKFGTNKELAFIDEQIARLQKLKETKSSGDDSN